MHSGCLCGCTKDRLQGHLRGVIIVVPGVHSQQGIENSAIRMQEVHSNSTLCAIQRCILIQLCIIHVERETSERDTEYAAGG